MSKNIQKKKKIIKQIKKISKNALSAVVANSKKINSNKINILRKNARKNNVQIKVIKNTLLKKAIHKTQFECLIKTLKKFTLIAYSIKHPGSAAKLLYLFSKENKNFKIKGAAYEGKFIKSKKIKKLAFLPTYKEAIQRFMFMIKELSIGKLIRTLISLQNKKQRKL
ncbi:MAG: 50S ribosomal protein L10 [Buchnera aphidicola (Periphyllus acericola)]|uniref:50S ribosomal protein L10 n=1 Tax=Buchnera aphidicola TaxID=9 RepID=UPI0030D1533F|nr:50S ribosomal protein L10 [Buchnera aphidicola (Periphyllus acericola)]